MTFPIKYPLKSEDMASFLSKVKFAGLDECWEYQDGGREAGGRFWLNGQTRYAYSVAYELAAGPVPEGQHVLHKSGMLHCCNPNHLHLGIAKETTLENIRERFYEKVQIDVTPAKACWQWLGAKNMAGYGVIQFNKGLVMATHISLYLHTGVWVPKGFHACHTCKDSKGCVKPDHVYIGTPRDNGGDKVRQQRSAKGKNHGSVTCPETVLKGQSNGNAKLKDTEVVLIRRTCEACPGIRGVYAFLGRLFGVGADVVRDI